MHGSVFGTIHACGTIECSYFCTSFWTEKHCDGDKVTCDGDKVTMRSALPHEIAGCLIAYSWIKSIENTNTAVRLIAITAGLRPMRACIV